MKLNNILLSLLCIIGLYFMYNDYKVRKHEEWLKDFNRRCEEEERKRNAPLIRELQREMRKYELNLIEVE